MMKKPLYEIGQFVNFKSDIEQGGKIIRVTPSTNYGYNQPIYTIEAPMEGFSGEYLKDTEEVTLFEDEIWV